VQAHGLIRSRAFGASVVAAILCFAALASGHSQTATAACPSVGLGAPTPEWITSAIWVADSKAPAGGNILAIDSQLDPRGGLIAIDPSGGHRRLPLPLEKAPVLLASLPRGPLLRNLGLQAVALKGLSGFGTPTDFLETSSAPEGKVGSIYQWVGLGNENALLAFGSLRNKSLNGGYELGFLRVPTSGAPNQTVLLAPKPPPSLNGEFFLLGPPYQYVAAVGDTGVYMQLAAESRVQFFELPAGANESRQLVIEGLPQRFLDVGEFHGTIHGPGQAPALYQQLEEMRLIAGIYGAPDGKQLIILTREPAVHGLTEWIAWRVQPSTTAGQPWRVAGHFTLPSVAPEVIPVFSPDTLFLIERQDLNANGKATISEMFRVPMSLIYQAGLTGLTCGP
jgi:hypothetical protein